MLKSIEENLGEIPWDIGIDKHFQKRHQYTCCMKLESLIGKETVTWLGTHSAV